MRKILILAVSFALVFVQTFAFAIEECHKGNVSVDCYPETGVNMVKILSLIVKGEATNKRKEACRNYHDLCFDKNPWLYEKTFSQE